MLMIRRRDQQHRCRCDQERDVVTMNWLFTLTAGKLSTSRDLNRHLLMRKARNLVDLLLSSRLISQVDKGKYA